MYRYSLLISRQFYFNDKIQVRKEKRHLLCYKKKDIHLFNDNGSVSKISIIHFDI
jgi:hypothetical protein